VPIHSIGGTHGTHGIGGTRGTRGIGCIGDTPEQFPTLFLKAL
jgi:hypothetical protein